MTEVLNKGGGRYMCPDFAGHCLHKWLQLFLFLIPSHLCHATLHVLPSRLGVYFLLLESGLVLGLAQAHSKGRNGAPARSARLKGPWLFLLSLNSAVTHGQAQARWRIRKDTWPSHLYHPEPISTKSQKQSHLADLCLTADAWGSPAKSNTTTQLSKLHNTKGLLF